MIVRGSPAACPAFDDALAHAKGGVFDDAEVLARLQRSGNSQAVAYQEQLHEHNRLDYDDLIRHGTRLLSVPAIARLYQARFGLVLVDEVQDLTLMQYDMVTALGSNRITFAGDLAQGIYSFAGADPVGQPLHQRAAAQRPVGDPAARFRRDQGAAHPSRPGRVDGQGRRASQ